MKVREGNVVITDGKPGQKPENLKECMEMDVKCWNAEQLPVYS